MYDQNLIVDGTQDEVMDPASNIKRGTPSPKDDRAALVKEWSSQVTSARKFWTDKAFTQMRRDMAFVAGRQWQDGVGLPGDENFLDDTDNRYVANITLRHVQTRTATIYGKNPKIISRRKPRLLSKIWDGSSQTLQAAMQAMSMPSVDPATGMPDPTPGMIVEDALQTMAENQRLTTMARTLELLFEHEIDEQPVPFKVQMKNVVRRGLTTGVGYVKLGWQRIMAYPPDVDAQIDTFQRQLATVERLSADMEDGEIHDHDAKAEQLRLTLDALSKTDMVTVREGLTMNFPHSTALIPDTNCQQLRGFVGCEWAAEEYFMTSDKIKEIYSVDVGSGGTGANGDTAPRPYDRGNTGAFAPRDRHNGVKAETYHCVWEIYNRTDGMVYVVCDGYPDFLVEPSPPDVKLERFFPWFPFVVNEIYSEDNVFPPSDVALMRDQQMEINRSRQGLREHRRAAMPKTYVRKGVLSPTDKDAIASPTPHAVYELDGLLPQEKIADVLQAHSGPSIDPRLYDTSPAYEDYLRALGQQEANLGGTSGATATEASIAEGSRVTSVSAVVDDLDEFLTELARAAGQVLFMECSQERVMEVVGPGAVWPEARREEVSREIYLDVEAASTGRPNKAQEVQVAQAMFPMLMQIPGVSPEFMGKEMLRRMDDKLDLTDAFAPGVPSIMMMNSMKGGAGQGAAPGGVSPQDAPAAQGGQGQNNAPSTQPPQVNAAARPPGRPPMVPLPGL